MQDRAVCWARGAALGAALAWALGAALAWALVGFAGSARAGQPLVFAVARLPMSLPVYVAEERGFFLAEGAAVDVADCDIGRRCLERLLAGAADLATAANLPIVMASVQGQRFTIVASMASSRNDAKIVTRRGSGIDSVAALAGRRVGTFTGTSAHFLLELSLLAAGVEPRKVTVVPLEPAEVVEALQSGRVDAAVVFEPYAWRAVQALGTQAQVINDRRLHVESWNMVAAAGLGPERDADLQAVCRALLRAERFIAAEPALARAILQRRLGLDAAAGDWLLPDIDYALELRQGLIRSLEQQARWALRAGHVRGALPNYLGYVRPAPLGAVRAAAVTVVH
jgi:ABC-type nitrate/sulfonate/bicarbonate transport system substrate-binding protein